MTIETIIEQPADGTQLDRLGKREPVREFLIKTSHLVAPVRDAELMLDTIFRMRPDLTPFAPHPSNRSAFVTEPKLTRESRWLWRLSVPYSTEVDQEELEAKELERTKKDKTNFAAKITITGWQEDIIITTDVDGKPIANLAGDPFPDVEDEEHSLQVSVEKNVRTIKPEWLLEYPNSINQEEMKFLGVRFPPKTLLMTDPQVGSLEQDQGVLFHPFSYKLIYRKGGWDKKRLNTGTREKREILLTPTFVDGFRLVKITDDKGDPVDEPVFLDKNGRAYRVGVDPNKFPFAPSDYSQPLRTELKPEEIITLTFKVKRVLPFKKLPHK